LTKECYITKPVTLAINPQDFSKCKDDLTAGFNLIEEAFQNKDMSKIQQLIASFIQTFIDCGAAYKETEACATPAIGAIEDIVALIKDAIAKNINPMVYISSVESLIFHVKGVVSECFNK